MIRDDGQPGAARYFRASWIVPVTQAPVKNGIVGMDGDQILYVGNGERLPPGTEIHEVNGIIMPGLVNAHTHLEESAIHSAIPPQESYPHWLSKLSENMSRLSIEKIESAVQFMVHKFNYEGVAAFGDVAANPLVHRFPIFRHVLGRGFLELSAFNHRQAVEKYKAAQQFLKNGTLPGFPLDLACASASSVSPELFYLVKYRQNRENNKVVSIHCAENRDEVDFLMTGGGNWRGYLEKNGQWDDDWKAPGKRTVAYLNDMGMLSSSTLLIHCIHITKADVQTIAARKAHVCWCPASNFWFKTGRSPVVEMVKKDINVCLGTDSPASNPVMSMWHEMREAALQYPELLPETILEMATINGSRALGMDYLIGSITPGKLNRIGLLKIENPPQDKFELISQIVHGGGKKEWRWLDDYPG